MSDPSENDANLSLEARAIVRELRRGNEASERIAVALERIAEGVNSDREGTIAGSLASVAWNVRTMVQK